MSANRFSKASLIEYLSQTSKSIRERFHLDPNNGYAQLIPSANLSGMDKEEMHDFIEKCVAYGRAQAFHDLAEGIVEGSLQRRMEASVGREEPAPAECARNTPRMR
jgi:hypothetical protein